MLLRHIRYLMAVADEGSFTRAALTLHVSQPALSQQIRQLEERMGVALLDRSDYYMHLADLKSYIEKNEELGALYASPDEWAHKVIRNSGLT